MKQDMLIKKKISTCMLVILKTECLHDISKVGNNKFAHSCTK